MEKILIIEDDLTIVKALTNALEFHGFTVAAAQSGAPGLEMLASESPDLVLLDVMLPGPDGFEVCRSIRTVNAVIPIIMLTAKDSESDKILGFELGIDDYVTKPFSAGELIARIRAILRRSKGGALQLPGGLSAIGDAVIDLANFAVCRHGVEHPLSPKEKAILEIFVTHPDTVISRDRIIDEVWGDEYFPTAKTVDNFIRKLRVKIEPDPSRPRFIRTVHGVGYILKSAGDRAT